jgi:hypothetical protein
MRQLSYFVILFLSLNAANAQGYYFNFGQNFTKYDYKNSLGQRNSNIKSDNGIMADFGYQWNISSNEKWQYKAGLSYQQFNATGKSASFDYSWTTNYLGIQNSLSYDLYTSNDDEVSIKINSGFTGSKIISGEQMIDNVRYNLTKEEEFKGLFLQPHLGIENEFLINESIKIGLGYRFSKAFRLNSDSKEKLNFINNTLYLNFKYSI